MIIFAKTHKHMSAENTARTSFLVMGFVMIILSLAIISHQVQRIHYQQQPATMSKLDSCEALAHEIQQRIDRIDSTVKEIKAMLQPIDTVYCSKVDSTCFSTILINH